MRALEGAVYGVRITTDGQLITSVVGDGEPKGICGTGLIAGIAALLDQGVMDATGRIVDASEVTTPRLQERLFTAGNEPAVALSDDRAVKHLPGGRPQAPARQGRGAHGRRNAPFDERAHRGRPRQPAACGQFRGGPGRALSDAHRLIPTMDLARVKVVAMPRFAAPSWCWSPGRAGAHRRALHVWRSSSSWEGSRSFRPGSWNRSCMEPESTPCRKPPRGWQANQRPEIFRAFSSSVLSMKAAYSSESHPRTESRWQRRPVPPSLRGATGKPPKTLAGSAERDRQRDLRYHAENARAAAVKIRQRLPCEEYRTLCVVKGALDVRALCFPQAGPSAIGGSRMRMSSIESRALSTVRMTVWADTGERRFHATDREGPGGGAGRSPTADGARS